ncbi:ester cyclase [Ciceribacter sp. L1K23]|uniref:ester cyclase n=1 Tax=Ciceribacter sp. L1K23 TaxID=2820276 RepID=UPI001B811F93|nr:ester cyclase [Ciceribacter sp. L1K23]MBR0554882.1 ester cyclase [Ciceribacter sp. L1K23]
MPENNLPTIYRAYIDCLNGQDFDRLGQFVHNDVEYNGERIGLPGYREMIEGDFVAIPDLFFDVRLLFCDPPVVASRLRFDCTPVGMLFGMPVNGTRVVFEENVFYQFADGKIRAVWSIIDKAAIAEQVDGDRPR